MRKSNKYNYSVTLDPVLALRVLTSILALPTFIILIIHGDEEFIAADIFVMCILILNLLMILHHSVSNVFKVTVELRQQTWSRNVGGQDKPRVATYFDYGLSVALLISLLIGSGIKSRYGGSWGAGVVIGYFVVICQFVMAVPLLEGMALTIKLTDTRGKAPRDTKVPDVIDDTERGSARRRTPESEERTQTPEDLV